MPQSLSRSNWGAINPVVPLASGRPADTLVFTEHSFDFIQTSKSNAGQKHRFPEHTVKTLTPSAERGNPAKEQNTPWRYVLMLSGTGFSEGKGGIP
jgi:hypothetical protein